MLRSFKLSNFKCFKKVEKFNIGTNWTVIVGQNNAGKSTLLRALDFTRVASVPYRGVSIEPDVPTDPNSKATFSIEIDGPDLRRFLFQTKSQLFWRRQSEAQNSLIIEPSQIEAEFQETISIGKLLFEGELDFQQPPANLQITNEKGTVLFPGSHFSSITPTADNSSFVFSHNNNSADNSYFVPFILSMHAPSVYLFSAERLYIGPSAIAENLHLEPNASNLAQVVHRLRQQPKLFSKFVELVREVIPSITDIVPSVSGGSVEIKISTHDVANDREDLNFSLQECGTGVSQICAILFVVVTSKYSKTVIIDEPNSFLHPGASKKLIHILKRFPHHQFIISTHSPELIEASDPDVVLQVSWSPDGSTVKQIDRKNLDQMRSALGDLGVSLVDVFSSDRIIWVEGPTEEICFKKILLCENTTVQSGSSIIPLRSTGEVLGKHKKAFFDIYSSASNSGSLLPVKFCFSIDSENLSHNDKTDLNRQSGDKFKFLPRRLFENYLLNPGAIAHVLSSAGTATTSGDVENWLKQNGNLKQYFASQNWDGILTNSHWLHDVHGAKILKDFFSFQSDCQLEYLKVSHGSELLDWILENDRQHVAELIAYVKELVN